MMTVFKSEFVIPALTSDFARQYAPSRLATQSAAGIHVDQALQWIPACAGMTHFVVRSVVNYGGFNSDEPNSDEPLTLASLQLPVTRHLSPVTAFLT